MVHSVDTLRLAEEISVRAERLARTVDVLLQINCSGEEQKSGIAVGAATHLAEMMRSLPHIRLVGLMTMAPLNADPEASRPVFRALRELRDSLARALPDMPGMAGLSMGMSQDYSVAVEEGATHLRIGTALFAPISSVE
jgi:hypothetical protein